MTTRDAKWMRWRIGFIGAGFCIALAAVLLKSLFLQAYDRDRLLSKAKQEMEGELNLGAVRGEIFDVNGERLAASVAVASVYVDPTMFRDSEATVEMLSRALLMDKETVLKNISKGSKKFAWVKQQISDNETRIIEAMNLPGVVINRQYRRVYPNGVLAANFLGFVGSDGEGLEGVERSMDKHLKATVETIKVKRDSRRRTMIDNVDDELGQSRGASVVLTIDRRIQHIAETALAQAVTEYKAKSGMVLVMRPKTGAVLAAAVWPTYDPNEYNKFTVDSRRNRILTDPFEPGSTFKVFVVAAALEERRVNPETVINCENGAFRVANHTVRDTANHGDLTVSQIIKLSSNIGSLKIGEVLGNDLLYSYLTRFSFGERTGLGNIAGEDPGLLRKPKNWHKIDAANIAFGQGVSVTGLQMIMAMSALANDGILMRPYVVDRVIDANGKVIEQYQPEIIRQVVSPLVARQVAAMLRMAVQKGGTAWRAEVAGYPVAGKTGTAQKAVNGRYAPGKYVASFLGFAPYHDPQLTVMVVLDEPKNNYYGGIVTTPAFKEIMEKALPLLDIPPTEDMGDPVWPLLQRNSGGAPGVVADNGPTNFIKVKLKKSDWRERKGSIDQNIEKNLKQGELSDLAFSFNEFDILPITEPGVMPNLTGLSMRQVLDLMGDYQMELEYLGSGYVVGQNPPPGSPAEPGQNGSIYFERQ